MAARIDVEPTGQGEFRVHIADGGSETSHRVTLKPQDYLRLTGGKVDPAELVRRSFEFLLEHEAKEAILGSFDLTLIGRYFPQYEQTMQRRLGA